MPLSRSERSLALASICAAALIFLPGVPRETEVSLPRMEIWEGPLLVFTGNEKGFIRPCGCSKPALGGIHRRATFLDSLRKEHTFHLLSVGDLVVEGGRQQRMKFESFLMAMSVMGYQALGLSMGELKLGVSYLKEMRAFASFPILSLNLYEGDERIFAPEVTLPDSHFRVTALLPESTLPIDGAVIRPPLSELTAWWSSLPPTDVPIVLWGGTETELTTLLASFRPADGRGWFVFGGNADQPVRLKGETQARAFSVGSKGRFVALLRPEEESFLKDVRLEESIKFHEDVNPILEAYRASLGEENLLAAVPRKSGGPEYVGDQSCRECHQEIFDALASSSHKRAWATLVETNDHHDPECVSCHVTGFGTEFGFQSLEKNKHLVDVTCESCHGPGELHVQTQAPMPVARPDPKFCMTCHDADNSPHFKYETYWPKIAHGKPESGK